MSGTTERAIFAAYTVVAALAVGVGSAVSQVLEIDADGAVTVYDRPAVFDARGATPIEPPRAATGPGSWRAGPVGPALAEAARAANLSPSLIEAVAWRESRFQPGVVSRAGAVGEMQLMPATARALGVDPYDTRQNFLGGATYLGGLLHRYDGDLIRALAAYNAGPGAVDKWRGVPPYRETRLYVAAIMDRLSQQSISTVTVESKR